VDSSRFQQSLLIIGSTRFNFKPPLEDYLYEMNLNRREGFTVLFEDLVDLDISDEEYSELMRLNDEENYYGLWNFARRKCKAMTLLEPFEVLREEIIGNRQRKIEPTLALTGVYFAFQLEAQYRRQLDEARATRHHRAE